LILPVQRIDRPEKLARAALGDEALELDGRGAVGEAEERIDPAEDVLNGLVAAQDFRRRLRVRQHSARVVLFARRGRRQALVGHRMAAHAVTLLITTG
jgi:hypothetical protein